MLDMTTPTFKSRAMLRVETRLGKSLEDYFAEKYPTLTQPQMAVELKVSDASVSRWMRELGIEARNPGQRPPIEATA